MQINVEELGKVQKKVKLEFDSNEVDKIYTGIAMDVKRHVEFKGYRKGKVPLFIVERLYGDYIKGKVEETLISENYHDILKNINATVTALLPENKDTPITITKGSPCVMNLVADILPTLELAEGYDKMVLKRPQYEITDEILYKSLQPAIKARSKLEDITDPNATINENSVVEFSSDTTVNGDSIGGSWCSTKTLAEFDKLKENVPYYCCNQDIRKLFIGMKVGDVKIENITLPEYDVAKRYAGKEAECTFTIRKLYYRNLVEVNDELAVAFGRKDKADLMDHVRKQLQSHIDQETQSRYEGQITDNLIAQYNIEFPESYIHRELDAYLRKKFGMMMDPKDDSWLHNQRIRDMFREPLIKELKVKNILPLIAKKEGITVEDKEVEDTVASFEDTIRSRSHSVEEYEYNKANFLEFMKQNSLLQKTLTWLIDKSQKEDVKEEIPEEFLEYHPEFKR